MNLNRAEKTAAPERFPIDRPAVHPGIELQGLYTLSEFRSSGQIAAEWALILGLIYACTRFWNPVLYVLCVILIGARQHALLVLMHDGAHYRLFRKRWLNDYAAEVLLAWPFFISMRSYRANHLAHHRHTNTEEDPDWIRKRHNRDWNFPKQWSELGWMLLKDVTGINTVSLLRLARTLSGATNDTAAFRLMRGGFYVLALAILLYTGAFMTFILYWIVPYFTWLALVLHIRSIAEHFCIRENKPAGRGTRTTRASILERVFLAPNHINYHIEHHMFPGVPFYRLPGLHQLLMSNAEFQMSAHVTRGYLGVLRECAEKAPRAS